LPLPHPSGAVPLHSSSLLTQNHKLKEKQYIAQIRALLALIEDEFSTTRQSLIGEKNNDTSGLLELIVAELQCHDILSQRIQHIIDGFEIVKDLFVDKKFKRSFLDLQFFQLITIGSDLEETITTTRILASTLTTPQFNGSKESVKLFARHNDVKHLLEFSNRTIMSCVAQRMLYNKPPLTSQQAATCLTLYTMESERIVLQWFLTNMPFGKRSDLLRTYKEEMKKIKDESIALF
jgi:hypothetical protein